MSEFEIRTCSATLTTPGRCCVCLEPATLAILSQDLIEHTRCDRHPGGDPLAVKPLVWDPVWGPR